MRPVLSWFCWNCAAGNPSGTSACRRCYSSRSASGAPAVKARAVTRWSLLLAAFTLGYGVMMYLTLSVLMAVPIPR